MAKKKRIRAQRGPWLKKVREREREQGVSGKDAAAKWLRENDPSP